MASQRLLLIAVAGKLATKMWNDIVLWSDDRTPHDPEEWSHNDWSHEIQGQVNRFVCNLETFAHMPPVLYRSEHVDLWSMGDEILGSLSNGNQDVSRHLYTNEHELVATWARDVRKRTPDAEMTPETLWLHHRVHEALNAWCEITEDRLLVLVRTVLSGLWSDDEISDVLQHLPDWYTETRP